jgi:hypothetical protein
MRDAQARRPAQEAELTVLGGGVPYSALPATPTLSVGQATTVFVNVETATSADEAETVAAITAAVNHELKVFLQLAPVQTKLCDRARNRTHAKKHPSRCSSRPPGPGMICR